MTKDEFYEEIEDLDDLIDFCYRNGCEHIIDGLRSVDEFDEWVWDCLEELSSRWYWYDLRSALNSLEAPSTQYFIPGAELEYSEVGGREFDSYMEDVLDWGDAEGFWDPDEDDWLDDEDEDDSDHDFDIYDEEPEILTVTVSELMSFVGV